MCFSLFVVLRRNLCSFSSAITQTFHVPDDTPSPPMYRNSLISDYLVNKPLQAAGMSADNVRKMNIWPRSEASRANVKF